MVALHCQPRELHGVPLQRRRVHGAQGPTPGEADRPCRRTAAPGGTAARTGNPAGGVAKFTFEGGGGDDEAPTTSDPPGGLLVPSSLGSEPSRQPRLGSSLRPLAALRRCSRPQGLPPKWAGLKATASGRSQDNVRWDWTRGSRCQVEAEGFASAC